MERERGHPCGGVMKFTWHVESNSTYIMSVAAHTKAEQHNYNITKKTKTRHSNWSKWIRRDVTRKQLIYLLNTYIKNSTCFEQLRARTGLQL